MAFYVTAGQQRALTLVNPISKAIFQEATKADCDFLSRSNIMDYSYDIPLSVHFLYSQARVFQAAARY